jgi:transposase
VGKLIASPFRYLFFVDDKQLFQATLGLKAPWFVSDVKLNKTDKRLDVFIDFERGARFPCPECHSLYELHDTSQRTWRHLNFFEYETYLHARVPRASCPKHGVRQVELPWARPNSGFTLHIEAMVLALSDEMSVAGIAGHLNVNEDSIWRILQYHVNEARKNVDLSQVDQLAIDEFAVQKGHKYVTFFYDLKGRRVIHIAEAKGKESFASFVQAVEGRPDLNKVKLVCMDMQPSFIGGCRETFPDAIMIFDHFHVIKLLNDTINRIRLEGARENEGLKKTQFLWLKNPDNLTEKQERKLLRVKDLDIKTAKAYHFKWAIQRTWQLPPQQARAYLRKWIAWAERCNLPEMQKLAKSIRNYLDGIVESVRQRVTSGYAEGLNNKIRTAFRRAYGFKAKKYRDTMIHLVAGGLRLPAQS